MENNQDVLLKVEHLKKYYSIKSSSLRGKKFPEYLDRNIDIISMMKMCEIRIVKVLALMLK